jgi:hypothetical protein
MQAPRPKVQVVEFREPGVFSGRPAPAPGALKRGRAPDGAAAPPPPPPSLKRALQGTASKRSVWASVAELGASGFQDSKRKALGSAALAAAGVRLTARAAGQQRMPFKMYLGVSRARKERGAKEAERARVSGVVLPKAKRKARKVRERAAPDEPIPNNVRGSVMHAAR